MIPTYVDRPTGNEKGSYIALDLGGTNFRVLTVQLKGSGRITGLKAMKFVIPKKVTTGDGKALFSFLARSIKKFLSTSAARGFDLGFTFSFPISQHSVASGDLVVWTKGFTAKGVVGRDVVVLLKEALRREDLTDVRVSALANDTVGTLVARAYSDNSCDVGVIIGTGTNACYREWMANIKKMKSADGKSGHMIINIEWGNFNKLVKTRYDRLLDRATDNPGRQILEKMVSGMYLGEVVRLALMSLARNGAFERGAKFRSVFKKPMSLKSEYVSMLEAGDPSAFMEFTEPDRRIIREVCGIVSVRAARISAAALAAVVTKMDSSLSRNHTIALDGSVYEKHLRFAGNIRRALKEVFGKKASRVKLVLSKDGSGKGAAIIAAVAASKKA